MRTYNFVFFSVMFFYSCQAPSEHVLIDNPGDEQILLVLDGRDTITVEPRQCLEVLVEFGRRKLAVNGEDAIAIDLQPGRNYLINPLRETYYVEKETEEEKVIVTTIGIFQFNGDFQNMGNEILLEKIWKSGPDNPSKTESGIVLTKLHRERDLLQMAHEEFINAIVDLPVENYQ